MIQRRVVLKRKIRFSREVLIRIGILLFAGKIGYYNNRAEACYINTGFDLSAGRQTVCLDADVSDGADSITFREETAVSGGYHKVADFEAVFGAEVSQFGAAVFGG